MSLFEISEDHLETGLRGYPCGYCTTSYVDPSLGLFYAGIPVSSLTKRSPEEVISLLYFGKDEKRVDFEQKLREKAFLSKQSVEAIRRLPVGGHPMKLLAGALLLLSHTEGVGDYREDALNVIAKMPHIVATVINHHRGQKEIAVDPNLGYMEKFVSMLGLKAELYDLFRLFNILHYDHGGGNLSAFVGKAVASGLEDLYGSLASAMCALEGPRHGKANQDSLRFVEKIASELGSSATEDLVEAYLRNMIAQGELIFGFGHAVLRVEDPRATVFYEYADLHYRNDPLVTIARHLRKVGPKVLGENPKIANPYPNVDAISGTLLVAAGFSYPEYFTVLFGLARCIGIAIQIVYERVEARGGKGTPIVRPKYLYKAR